MDLALSARDSCRPRGNNMDTTASNWIRERINIQTGEKVARIRTRSRRVEYECQSPGFRQVMITHVRLFDDKGGYISEHTEREFGGLYRIARSSEQADIVSVDGRTVTRLVQIPES